MGGWGPGGVGGYFLQNLRMRLEMLPSIRYIHVDGLDLQWYVDPGALASETAVVRVRNA